jgi:F-type H+-transporting ATPase subunit b
VAQETSDQIIRDATQRAQHRESEILRQANLEASAMLDKAAADIQLEKKKALNEVKDQITDLAMDIAGKVVGRTVTEADRAALVDSFIDELGGAV